MSWAELVVGEHAVWYRPVIVVGVHVLFKMFFFFKQRTAYEFGQ